MVFFHFIFQVPWMAISPAQASGQKGSFVYVITRNLIIQPKQNNSMDVEINIRINIFIPEIELLKYLYCKFFD